MIAAGLTFWLSWFLMPDPGTTDTAHILSIVKQSRNSVFVSVIVQIISSVLYAAALFLLVKISFAQKRTLTGAIVLGIGVMGLCADAFFHLLAWFMTHESVTIQEDVVRVMEFMQTDALFFLVPLLLPFFIGSLVLGIGLQQQAITSSLPKWMFLLTFLVGPVIGILSKTVFHYKGPAVMLITLGIFALGHVSIGLELIRGAGRLRDHLAKLDIQTLTVTK